MAPTGGHAKLVGGSMDYCLCPGATPLSPPAPAPEEPLDETRRLARQALQGMQQHLVSDVHRLVGRLEESLETHIAELQEQVLGQLLTAADHAVLGMGNVQPRAGLEAAVTQALLPLRRRKLSDADKPGVLLPAFSPDKNGDAVDGSEVSFAMRGSLNGSMVAMESGDSRFKQVRSSTVTGASDGEASVRRSIPRVSISSTQGDFSHLKATLRNAKRSAGIGPRSGTEALAPLPHPFFATMVTVCEHPLFDGISAIMILVNAATIGAQADFACRHVSDEVPLFYQVCEKLFCALFTVEFLCRVLAYRVTFFTRTGWFWGCFDAVVVGMQLTEEIMIATVGTGTGSNVGFVRLVRMLRLVRILRVFRLIRFMDELRNLTVSVLDSMRSLFWTLVLLMLGIYGIGVYFTQSVADYRLSMAQRMQEEDPTIIRFFGGLASSMYSLYEVMSGGVNWDDLSYPLITQISPLQGVIMALYVAFTVLALTNVVTGVFVEGALRSAKREEEEFMVMRLHELFEKTDEDKTGRITTEQFNARFNSPDIRTYLQDMNVNPEEAHTLFNLLDSDRSGSIDYEEFVGGCMRLRGTAKALDIIMVIHEVRQLTKLVEAFVGQAQDHMTWLEGTVSTHGLKVM